MKLIQTELLGVSILKFNKFKDERGYFIKTFNKELFNNLSLESNFKEHFFSLSQKDVIRGMHFQLPPYCHSKLVYVVNGEILDVILDIRKNSATFGKYIQIPLLSSENQAIYIEQGFAHGFLSKTNNTIVSYLQSEVYKPDLDSGINYKSFGMNWEIVNPIVSDKDKELISFNEFNSLFNREF